MEFKSLEMNGFKSFVDHTCITFGEGVTVIVGPNGCGKSNISDAIRWVIGEQRPKFLRGVRMEDFIFSGSSARKQAGMAEVSITLSGIAGKLSRPELSEYDEVTVTRRLFRSGESEYLINKTPCRLKDVVDLFLDTGISTRAFSIIEQDQVQRIVSSKPEDRRYIIEEAAGIMKYKNRRHQAMNKLDASMANLERLNDITGELERQKNSLKRQANKAERYGKFKSEMDELFLATASDEWRGLKQTSAALDEEISRLEAERASMEAEISAKRNRLFMTRSSIDAGSRDLESLREEEYRIRMMVDANEGKIELFRNQIEEISELSRKLADEFRELGKREEDNAGNLEKQANLVIEREEEYRETAEELQKLKAMFAESEQRIGNLDNLIRRKEKEVEEIAALIAVKNRESSTTGTKIEMLENRRRQIESKMEEPHRMIPHLRKSSENKQEHILESRRRVEALTAEISELNARLEKLADDKKRLEDRINGIRTMITGDTARLESLEEFEKSYEGYQDGIRSLLRLKEEKNETAAKLRGTLLEKINVDARFETGIETVLGNRLQALLVEKPEDAVDAINLLHRDRLGRATFMAINANGPEQSGFSMEIAGKPGVIGPAGDLVSADNEIRSLLDRLLHNVIFVKDIATATTLSGTNGFIFVTPLGDVVDSSGVISGGASEGQSGGILERRREIGEISGNLSNHRVALEEAEKELEEILSETAVAESGRREKQALLKSEEFNLLNEKKNAEAIESELERNKQMLTGARLEMESIENEKMELARAVSVNEEETKELDGKKTELESGLAELLRDKQESHDKTAEIRSSLTDLEIALASLAGELKMANAEKERLENVIAELAGRREKVLMETASADERKTEMEKEITRLEEEIHDGLEQKEELSGKITAITNALQTSREDIDSRETELKTVENLLEQKREELNAAKIKQSETLVRIDNLLVKISERNLAKEALENFDSSGFNMEESRERMEYLRNRMAKFGDVNMAAIDDYRRVTERLNFLTEQSDDLLKSIGDIKGVIDRLNRTTKRLFLEAFTQIRDNFEGIFQRLFNGGEASIVLTDESNIMDTGVEIIVRPPGKKRQNLTLLSAGEKALTAVSVLFSVFMVKPSPFCLLDEVDAPLDEANIQRFKDMLIEFSSTTQFLVITHNQKTMAFADRLYGITMQEPGISKVLSVDMVETDTVIPEKLAAASG